MDRSAKKSFAHIILVFICVTISLMAVVYICFSLNFLPAAVVWQCLIFTVVIVLSLLVVLLIILMIPSNKKETQIVGLITPAKTFYCQAVFKGNKWRVIKMSNYSRTPSNATVIHMVNSFTAYLGASGCRFHAQVEFNFGRLKRKQMGMIINNPDVFAASVKSVFEQNHKCTHDWRELLTPQNKNICVRRSGVSIKIMKVSPLEGSYPVLVRPCNRGAELIAAETLS